MRILSSLPVLFMFALMLYGIWDLKLTGFQPPVPVAEFAEDDPKIIALMTPLERALKSELSTAVIPRIEETLQSIETEYGAQSVELVQAKSAAAIMLHETNRTDLALPYMRSALEVSRTIFGNEHRETALVLNDLAILEIENSPQKLSQEGVKMLREAIEIRMATIGPNHVETVGAQIGLADQLYLFWQRNQGSKDDIFLVEASDNLKVALVSAEKIAPTKDDASALSARLLLARVSHAREDHPLAATLFTKALPLRNTQTDPALFVIFSDSYNDYATSLRAIGKNEQADYMIGYINTALTQPDALADFVASKGTRPSTAQISPAPQAAPEENLAPAAKN